MPSVKSIFIHVVLPIVIGSGVAYGVYRYDYNQGFDEGRSAGIVNGRDEGIKLWEKEKPQIEKAFRENELEQIIQERYGQDLLEAQNRGRLEGNAEGYADGRKFGLQECRSGCADALEEMQYLGRLWKDFQQEVVAFEGNRRRGRDAVRAAATTIVEIARAGRAASEVLREQLNVGDIEEALEANDVDMLRSRLEQLAKSLDIREETWQRNYVTLVNGSR